MQRLTIDVTSYVGVRALVLVDHLNDPQQVLLLELLQRFSNLFVVVFLCAALAASKTALLSIVGQGACFTEALLQGLGRVLEYDCVDGLVL